jgi:glycosyltransferase involved in cell wall biosynthesis
MAGVFGFQLVFLSARSAVRIFRPIQYIINAFKTVLLLLKRKPKVVWIQLPPVPLLTAVLMYRRYFDNGICIIADCHNPMFSPPWSRWPGMVRQLNKVDLVLVHNHLVTERACDIGISKAITHVLEDAPALIRASASSTLTYPRPSVLFLTAFARDEPIREIYAAAGLAPELHFVIAGDIRRASGRHRLYPHPPNVILSRYLSGSHLDASISDADVLLCLTKHPDEQLSTAAEAVGAGKAMVLSDTGLLRKMYDKGAIYVNTRDPASLAAGCRMAVADHRRLEEESSTLRSERWERWRTDAAQIHLALRKRIG